jgi:hypothetical protein
MCFPANNTSFVKEDYISKGNAKIDFLSSFSCHCKCKNILMINIEKFALGNKRVQIICLHFRWRQKYKIKRLKQKWNFPQGCNFLKIWKTKYKYEHWRFSQKRSVYTGQHNGHPIADQEFWGQLTSAPCHSSPYTVSPVIFISQRIIFLFNLLIHCFSIPKWLIAAY